MIYSAKIVQMSEKTSSSLECFSECSLSYEKIVQASGMTKQNTQFLFFIPERRLSYEKIVQMSEKASSLLECFSECSLYCSKKRNRPRWQMKQASLALEAYFVGT